MQEILVAQLVGQSGADAPGLRWSYPCDVSTSQMLIPKDDGCRQEEIRYGHIAGTVAGPRAAQCRRAGLQPTQHPPQPGRRSGAGEGSLQPGVLAVLAG